MLTLPALAEAPLAFPLDTLQTSSHFAPTEPFEVTEYIDHQPECAEFLHAGWASTRRRVALALFRTGHAGDRLHRFCKCASESWVFENVESPGVFRISSNHCGDRLCVNCGNLRSYKIRRAFFPFIAALKRPPLFITLTLAGAPEETLAAKISRLYSSFSDLRRSMLWRNSVKGGVAFLEIKWSERANRWHPHLHILADSAYLRDTDLSKVWHALTGDSFIVDVQRCSSVSKAAFYVTKYASKPMNSSFSSDPVLLDEAVLALKGRRLLTKFGTWYKVDLKGADDEELDDGEDDASWVSVGSLGDVIARAKSGDKNAATAIEFLERTRNRTHEPGDRSGAKNP